MEYVDYDLNNFELILNSPESFSGCEFGIFGVENEERKKQLRCCIVSIDCNFHDIKAKMVEESYYLSVNVDRTKVKDFNQFISGLKLSAIIRNEENNCVVVLDNNDYFFGHYIEGCFWKDWTLEYSYIC